MKFKEFKKKQSDITHLVDGSSVNKNSGIIDLIGDIDWLNSVLGLIVSLLDKENSELSDKEVRYKISGVIGILKKIQAHLMFIGSDVGKGCKKGLYITDDDIKWLEKIIDDFYLIPVHQFIIPGGSIHSSLIHVARSICRSVERKMYDFDKIDKDIKYMDRLSDFLFVLALYINQILGMDELVMDFDRKRS